MRTWEVIAEHGLFSYEVLANPKYRVRGACCVAGALVKVASPFSLHICVACGWRSAP